MSRKFEGDLSLVQRVKLRWTGWVYVGDRTREGWSGNLPFYVFRCEEHGLIESFPQTHREYLSCPFCVKDSLERIGEES